MGVVYGLAAENEVFASERKEREDYTLSLYEAVVATQEKLEIAPRLSLIACFRVFSLTCLGRILSTIEYIDPSEIKPVPECYIDDDGEFIDPEDPVNPKARLVLISSQKELFRCIEADGVIEAYLAFDNWLSQGLNQDEDQVGDQAED